MTESLDRHIISLLDVCISMYRLEIQLEKSGVNLSRDLDFHSRIAGSALDVMGIPENMTSLREQLLDAYLEEAEKEGEPDARKVLEFWKSKLPLGPIDCDH